MEVVTSEMLKVGQGEMLNILKEIDKICVKHNIKYWLDAGTLLGAIRHKGFIPWDDDCDVGMMREDFEKFCNLCKTELGEDYFLQTRESDPMYRRKLIKIRSNRIKMVEHAEDENEKYHQGVFVDIFVFDYYPRSAHIMFPFFQFYLRQKGKRKLMRKGSFERMLFNIMNLPLSGVYIILREMFKMLWKERRKDKNLPYIGAAMEHARYVPIVEKSLIFPITKRVLFEDVDLYIPNKPGDILTKLYGDYLVLPKEENRVWHAKKICYFKK